MYKSKKLFLFTRVKIKKKKNCILFYFILFHVNGVNPITYNIYSFLSVGNINRKKIYIYIYIYI